jgi:hypothetical protein
LLVGLALLASGAGCRSVTRASIVGPPEPTVPLVQLVRVPTRPKVLVTYLLLSESPRPPQAVAVMIPGAGGLLHVDRLPDAPAPSTGADLLVRARHRFISRELSVAIVDAPSDRPNGIDDAFRAGPAHAADLEAVVASVRQRFPEARIYLVGSDRGAISTANLAVRLQATLSGAVLASAPYRANVTGPGLTGFDWSTIPIPLLLVHHEADECRASPYDDARAVADRHSLPLEAISGGAPPDSAPCDPLSAHGYHGREQRTADRIRAWMLSDRGAALRSEAPPRSALAPPSS